MGYTNLDRKQFLLLHSFAFVVHAISAGFAFHLSPPPERANSDVYVETTNFKLLADGKPSIEVLKVTAFADVNAGMIIAVNEALACFSHALALLVIGTKCLNLVKIDDKAEYRGRSRPEEYWRRWIEYAITAGLLEVGLLVGQGELNLILLICIFGTNVTMQIIGLYNDYVPRKNWNAIPSVSAFLMMSSIIAVFSFRTANNISTLDAMQYEVLTAIFAIFYMSFGIHQMIYLYYPTYAKKIDVDKIYIVLGFTAKIVLTWSYFAISRQSAVELGTPFDDKVPWESGTVPDSASGWDWAKWGIITGSVVVIALSYAIELYQDRPVDYSLLATKEPVVPSYYKPANSRTQQVKRRKVNLNF